MEQGDLASEGEKYKDPTVQVNDQGQATAGQAGAGDNDCLLQQEILRKQLSLNCYSLLRYQVFRCILALQEDKHRRDGKIPSLPM